MRQSLFGENMIHEEVGKLLRGDVLVGADEDCLLGEHANKGDNGVIRVSIMSN